ncbi:MAG TPA: YfcC family protein, partial [Bacteroidales bacterium]|nr:YfcC family protein [Bacteroidales bacterium]HPT52669.1 YfcC family protein [Bacteroidales bacterium]
MASKIKIPHTFTIVFFIVIVCAILTWIIPGGEFQRETVMVDGEEKEVVIADSYHKVENEPQTWQVFTAFYNGFKKSSNIIVFILMIGGAFWIMNSTKAIDKGIYSFLNFTNKLQKKLFFQKIGVNNIIITLIMILFSLFGAIFGMSEETLAFIVIFVPLAISMGYDSVVGVLMCYVAAHVGFAGAIFNPFTIGIAQGLSNLQPFSGLEYRCFCWLILTTIAIAFTLFYANRVKKNPQRSFMYELDSYWRDRALEKTEHETTQSHTGTWLVYGLISGLLIFLAIRFPITQITIGNNIHTAVLFPIIAGI